MKDTYAILATTDPIVTYIIVGPLCDSDIASVPSGQLIAVEHDEEMVTLRQMFPAPEGFTKIGEIESHSWRQEILEAGINTFRSKIFCVYAVIEEVGLVDHDYLMEVIKRVPVQVTPHRRPPKHVVEQEVRGKYTYTIWRYDPVTWEQNKKKRTEERKQYLGGITSLHFQQVEIRCIRDTLARALEKKLLGSKSGACIHFSCWDKRPTRVLQSIRVLYEQGKRVFGANFWTHNIKLPTRAVYGKGWKRRHVRLLSYIKNRHTERKVKRPDKQFKDARFVWDLIYSL